MYPKRAHVIRKCASRRGLASPRVTGCNAPQVSDEYTMLVFSFLSEVSRAIVSPAIYWMQQNEGRNLLEMPAFLREHFARLAELATDARAFLPDTAAFVESSGMGDDLFLDLASRASPLLAAYGANRLGAFDRFPWSLGSLIDEDRSFRMAYARALVDGVRRGWFGEARSLKAEKLDFAKLRTQEMWPLVERCARDGTLAPALARHVALWVGQTQTNTAQNERGVKAARNEARGHEANGLAAAVRGSSVATPTGPHLDEFMEEAAAREDARRGGARGAGVAPGDRQGDDRRGRRRGAVLRGRVKRGARGRRGARGGDDGAPRDEDAARAAPGAARAGRRGRRRGRRCANAEANAAAPRGAAPAPAPAAAQDLAEANDHVVLCRLAPVLAALPEALAELYINRASGGDPVTELAALLLRRAAEFDARTYEAPECPLCAGGAFTFERDALRDLPRHLTRQHLGQCLADLAAETDARNHEVLRCLGLARYADYAPPGRSLAPAEPLNEDDVELISDFDEAPGARDAAYRAVAAVISTRLAVEVAAARAGLPRRRGRGPCGACCDPATTRRSRTRRGTRGTIWALGPPRSRPRLRRRRRARRPRSP